MGPLRLSERLLGGLGAGLPFSVSARESEAGWHLALDAGQVAALIVIPPEFSRNAATGAAVRLTVVASEHRTPLETQFGASLGRQIAAGRMRPVAVEQAMRWVVAMLLGYFLISDALASEGGWDDEAEIAAMAAFAVRGLAP